MNKDWHSNYMKNITDNIFDITAMQKSLRTPLDAMGSIKEMATMQESLLPSLGVMDSIKGMTAMRRSFRPSFVAMDSIKGMAAMQESLSPSLGMMGSAKRIASIQESLRSSLRVMERLNGVNAMQESFRLSSGVLESMRIDFAGISEIAKASLEIPNIKETVNSALGELSAENLKFDEKFNILKNVKIPFEYSNPSHVDEEIKIEDNEFARYWLAMYESIIRVYSVVDSSLAAAALRDLIMVLSFIISMQGGQTHQINFYNETDSNVQVNINGNKMNVIITNPEESDIKKDVMHEEIDIIFRSKH